MKKPLILMILDGFGIAPEYGNAIMAVKKPNLDRLFCENSLTQIGASGPSVGLPDGQMGNPEVGHTDIGVGRIVYWELTRITKEIEDGDFYKNPALIKAVAAAKAKGTVLHLIGLLSDGSMHSHNGHLYALLEMAKQNGLSKVYVHALLDGRGVLPSSGKGFVEDCLAEMREIGVGETATMAGRHYAIDRDNRRERISEAYNAMVLGEGMQNSDPVAAIAKSYEDGVTDEFIVPIVCGPRGRTSADDSVISFNPRSDRAREPTHAFADPDFIGFERVKSFSPLTYVCTTQYDATMPNVGVTFHPQSPKNTLGEYLSDLGMTWLRIAETEKYVHVTFLFNGGVETIYPGEDRVLIHSPRVATYDLQPEMSAYAVTDTPVEKIDGGMYDMIILSYANCDMVEHTRIFNAAKAAVEAVDTYAGRAIDMIEHMYGIAVITAGHGNAEKMYEESSSPFTAHTTNPVPSYIVGYPYRLRGNGKLVDIAPIMLKILDLSQPAEMMDESITVD